MKSTTEFLRTFKNNSTQSRSISMTTLLVVITFALVLVAGFATVEAQIQTVGLFVNDSSAYQGYTLFAPLRYTSTYLLDMEGRVVHSWDAEFPPGNSVYMLENGNLLRPARPSGGGGGLIQEIAWDGTVVWEFDYYDENVRQHHDIQPMPNGNILILAWSFMSPEEALAAGRTVFLETDSAVWPEHVIELEPTGSYGGNIVWEWYLWDHLIQDQDVTKDNFGVVADHPELVNINYYLQNRPDWIHANAIDYNPQLDQVMISSRSFSELWIIDHSTTTAEAATHTGGNSGMGGDLMYRWGNPLTYGAGLEEDRTLYFQHNTQWIAPGLPGEGNVLVFNNGGQERLYSTADEIITPVDGNGDYPQPTPGTEHGPESAVWSYGNDSTEFFYSWFISGVQRLQNGNTLICSGADGTFIEVTPDKEIVWKYINPVSTSGPTGQLQQPPFFTVFRCTRIAADYPGLAGRDLTPGLPLETYPIQISGTSHFPVDPIEGDQFEVTANITSDSGFVSLDLYADTGAGYFSVPMFDDGAHGDGVSDDGLFGAILPSMSEGTVVEYYIYAIDSVGQYAADPTYPELMTYTATIGSPPCCIGNRGDLNSDGTDLDIVDLTCAVDFLFGAGCEMLCADEADVNGDGTAADIVDLTFIVDWLFGEAPTTVVCP